MSTLTRVGTGQLWLRIGLFAVASLLLEIAFQFALFPALEALNTSGTDVVMNALVPAVLRLPMLAAAALVCFLPRRVGLDGRGSARPWYLCALLLALGLLIVSVFGVVGRQPVSWSDSSSVALGAMETWILFLTGLPLSLVTTLIAMTFLWGLARRVLSAAFSGVVVAVALALPGTLAVLYGAIVHRTSSAAELATWLGTTLLTTAVWAVFYSGLGRLVDGRGAVARTVLSLLVIAPAVAGTQLWLLGVGGWGLSAGSEFASILLGAARGLGVPLVLGLGAWALSSLRQGSTTRSRAASAASSTA